MLTKVTRMRLTSHSITNGKKDFSLSFSRERERERGGEKVKRNILLETETIWEIIIWVDVTRTRTEQNSSNALSIQVCVHLYIEEMERMMDREGERD